MTGGRSSEEQLRSDVASIREDVAVIAGRPRRMLRLAAIAAGIVVVGFLVLAVIGSFVGPKSYGDVYNQAYSQCVRRGGSAEACRSEAYGAEADAVARDHPEYRRAVGN